MSQDITAKLAEALRNFLSAHEAEARAYLTAQVASENFSRRSAKADEHAHLQAMLAASNAEKAAREALSTYEAQQAQSEPVSEANPLPPLQEPYEVELNLGPQEVIFRFGTETEASAFFHNSLAAQQAARVPLTWEQFVAACEAEYGEDFAPEEIAAASDEERKELMRVVRMVERAHRIGTEQPQAEPLTEAERKDAARYRALRDDDCHPYGICIWDHEDGWAQDARKPDVVDAAIDAAMRGTEQGEG